MMELAVLSGFPKFLDGDVSIVLSPTKIYQLHSSRLRRHSLFFSRALDARPGPQLTTQVRQEGQATYRFHLAKNDPDDVGTFIRKGISDSGRVPRDNSILSDRDRDRVDHVPLRSWDWLFGSFYGRQPEFDDRNLATVLSSCIDLVNVAERIGSVDTIRDSIDLALLRQDRVLWTAIMSNPMAWAELGRRVHSPTIFREAVCHLVGQWQRIREEGEVDLHEDIIRVCQQKFNELSTFREAVEMRILGYYPESLLQNVQERPDPPSSDHIYIWMDLCFFRQWFAQAMADDRTRKAPDGGFAFYTALAHGGEAYLSREDFKHFYQYFPMNREECHVLEANMNALKEDVKQFVTDIVFNRSHVDREEHAINWLTCTVIDQKDFPWYISDDEKTVVGNDAFDFGDGNSRDQLRSQEDNDLRQYKGEDGASLGAAVVDYVADDEK